MVFSPILWGNVTLLLDQVAFEKGYAHGRQYYFEDAGDEEERNGRHPCLTASSLLGLIAIRDESGYYQLDDGCDHSTFAGGVEELLGVLAGYLSGPLHPETHEEHAMRVSECTLIEHQT